MGELQYSLDMDVEVVRSRYGEAIAAYRDAARALRADRPDVPAASFGSGFTEHGQRISDALEALSGTSERFLRTRSSNWEQVLLLADATVNTDTSNSDALSAFGEVDAR